MKLLKKRANPCCGFFLQGAVRWTALFDVPALAFGIGLLIADGLNIRSRVERDKIENPYDYHFQLVLWGCYSLHVVVGYPLVPVLYIGAVKRIPFLLKLWIVMTILNNSWALLIYWVNTAKFGIHVFTLPIYHFYIVFKYYSCWVVWVFYQEVVIFGELNAALRNLTEEEVEEFYRGGDTPLGLANSTGVERAPYERYRKEDFEIPMQNLVLDKGNPLGEGAYGKVYRGELTNKSGEKCTVAVKTVESSNTDVVCFKALLAELKVMTYIGKHCNIVSLLGACTENIRERQLYIVVELCALGSLEDFLRTSRPVFISQVFQGVFSLKREMNDEYIEGESVSTADLIDMSKQLANGMDYLESRKVIHGDLAARNVLLTIDRQVKITDFGLARQLYQYSVYVKTQNTPLPWRWLALEALTDMTFSCKSDVWSYGVTLWEIFNLGEVPWSAHNFTAQFITDMKNGVQLPCPKHASRDIYEIMRQCWELEPDRRPSFSDIRDRFQAIMVSAKNERYQFSPVG